MNPLAQAETVKNSRNPLSAISDELTQVESMLRKECGATSTLLHDALQYTLDGGGKRLRPALVILAAQAAGARGERVIYHGVIAELIHTSSLLHDDVIDNATLRRGRPSVGNRWGNTISIIAGDYLVSRALQLLSKDGDLQIVCAYSKLLEEMCEGEALQAMSNHNVTDAKEAYLEIIGRKTAAFFSTCCRVGGMISAASSEKLEALHAYGYHLGIAFQIVDDVRDLVGDSRTLGKSNGNDLREGRATLPILYALDRATPLEQARLQQMLSSHELTNEDILEAASIARRYQTPQSSMDLARSHSNKAIDVLQIFPESPSRQILQEIADDVVAW